VVRRDFDSLFPDARFCGETEDEERLLCSISASVSFALLYGTQFWTLIQAAAGLPEAFDWFEGQLVSRDRLPRVISAARAYLTSMSEDDVTVVDRYSSGGGPFVEEEVRIPAEGIRAAVEAIIDASETCLASGRDLGVSL
jgi:hypothetical protein